MFRSCTELRAGGATGARRLRARRARRECTKSAGSSQHSMKLPASSHLDEDVRTAATDSAHGPRPAPHSRSISAQLNEVRRAPLGKGKSRQDAKVWSANERRD